MVKPVIRLQVPPIGEVSAEARCEAASTPER